MSEKFSFGNMLALHSPRAQSSRRSIVFIISFSLSHTGIATTNDLKPRGA